MAVSMTAAVFIAPSKVKEGPSTMLDQPTLQRWSRLWRETDGGATAVEYCFMVSLIAMVIFSAAQAMGLRVYDAFNNPLLTVALN